MDRREFLKSAAALGAVVSLPLKEIETVSQQIIDQAWADLGRYQQVFYVSEVGTLTAFGEDDREPQTRTDLMGLPDRVRSIEELVSLSLDSDRVVDEIDFILDNESLTIEIEDLEEFLSELNPGTILKLISRINDWLADYPDEFDIEMANLCGYSGQGWALDFFRHDMELQDIFDIAIIEGEFPGSSYYAAELRMDIHEANALASREGIPLLFVPS